MNLVVLVSVLCLISCAESARPVDQIVANSTSYYISNETYVFQLAPLYWVPLQVNKHTIYTSSVNSTKRAIKRVFVQKRSSLSLSQENFEFLQDLLDDSLPQVQVEQQKRSVYTAEGLRRIDLAPGYFVTVSQNYNTKRSVSIDTGSTLCVHVPFFTQCDNTADIDQVKTTIGAQNTALRAELDSYKKTNDARDNELTKSLNRQRELIKELNNQQLQAQGLILALVAEQKTELTQTQHGDMVIHSQINGLKRVTSSLLRYFNTLGSTDPRAVVALPALNKLFSGYLSKLSELRGASLMPIVDARKFNFSEQVLPHDAVKNIKENGGEITGDLNMYTGFPINYKYECASQDMVTGSFCKNPQLVLGPDTFYMYGPFHQKHYGVYEVIETSTGSTTNSRESTFVVRNKTVQITPAMGTQRCVYFLGFPVLANFEQTPYLLNGIADETPLPDPGACDNYRITKNTLPNGKVHYKMFAITEGIVVPFYSNCQRENLKALNLTLPTGYMSAYPDTSAGFTTVDTFLNKFFHEHYVSPTCYINLEPEWIGMQYYINSTAVVLPDIPRGFKLNQFTINPDGELASSLEFMYTPEWALMYEVQRISIDTETSNNGNRVIVDEVDILDGSKVLFLLKESENRVIDASDSIYGQGNNGRDCIQVDLATDPAQAQFDHDLTDCFFQNDKTGYDIGNYVKGLVTTTGIARFTSKFDLSISPTTTTIASKDFPSYTFALTPRPVADFNFYIVTHPEICPQISSRSILPDGTCRFRIFYKGSSTVSLGSYAVAPEDVGSFYGTVQVPPSDAPYTLNAAGTDCLRVTCRQTLNSTYVALETPSFQIISADDMALETSVRVNLDELMQGSLSQLSGVEAQVFAAMDNIAHITYLLDSINFNVSQLYPYEDFTDLRNNVDGVVAQVGSNYCSGPFESMMCWLRSSASILIAVGISLVVVGIICIIAKTKAGKKLKKLVFPKRKRASYEAPSSPESPGPCVSIVGAPDSEYQKKPASDFQLLATN